MELLCVCVCVNVLTAGRFLLKLSVVSESGGRSAASRDG